MSQENVEIARRGVEAWNTGGPDALSRFWAEDIVWHDAPNVPDGSVYEGREATVEHLRQMVAATPFQLDVEELIDLGDQVFCAFRMHVHGPQSGLDIDGPWLQVLEMRDGLAVRIRNFQDRTQALEAAGLRE